MTTTNPAAESSTADRIFPFTAVVGQDDAKLALVLATIDPRIGGVLLRGDKGSAKTTLARGLAELQHGPFVDLPLGATEERVVGSLDLAAALGGDGVRVQTGLLAAADRGVLYVDEINLLADHLVDVLLDVAVSGRNRIERDAISHEHDARFILIGSMNPEEGDLRPQLIDRFGLAIDITTTTDPAERADAVRRRLDFDADPTGFRKAHADAQADLARRLDDAIPAPLDDTTLLAASRICVAAGTEGLRADLILARAAAALAGWEGRDRVQNDDLRRVAPLVLAHRSRQSPLDPPGTPPPNLDQALDDALDPPEPPDAPDEPGHDSDEPDHRPDPADDGDPRNQLEPGATHHQDADDPTAIIALTARRTVHPDAGAGRRSPATAARGRLIGSKIPDGPVASVAPVATTLAAATRWATEPDTEHRIEAQDLREPERETRTGNLLVLAVDASASMDTDARMAAVKGALLGLLVDAYQRRDRVALVTFGGAGAEVVLRPTGSVEIARDRLEELPTGGDTPLAEGIEVAAGLALRSATPALQPLLVLVSDGRATAGTNALDRAMAAAADVARRHLPAVVLDVEPEGPGRLGLASELATAMAARHLPITELRADRLEQTLRNLT